MAIVTFWSSTKKETGQTSSAIATATYMAIEHNYKILLLSATCGDKIIENSFWSRKKETGGLKDILGQEDKITLDSGIEGIAKLMNSNRITSETITNYTKIVFKDRLEIISGFDENEKAQYERIKDSYYDLIQAANQYYDIVIVDLEKGLNEYTRKILGISDVIIANLNQRIDTIDSFQNLKSKEKFFAKQNVIYMIGKYDSYSKYNIKNITRYTKAKNAIHNFPYNTLFFEASCEGNMADLFLKIRLVSKKDRNMKFVDEIQALSESITYTLQNIRKKM